MKKMQRPPSIAQQYRQRNDNIPSSSNPNHNSRHSNSFSNSMSAMNDSDSDSNWQVKDDVIREVPNFYPLDKNSKYVRDRPSQVANRISECCRVMSVQAHFDNDLATADLKTSEHVEIHLSLWKSTAAATSTNATTPLNIIEENEATSSSVITIVEPQRRNGDAVAYYKYCRNILSAADGTFSPNGYLHQDQEENVKMQKRSTILQGLKNERSKRQLEEKSANIALAGRIEDHDSNNVPGAPFLAEAEDSLLALEIAASLLKKDRMDARQLGIETLCLLTDPIKAGIHTALLASKVVLFGSVDAGNESLDDDDYIPSDDLGIREAILSLVQFGKLGEYADFDDEDDDDQDINPEDKEFNALLHNLALAVLANALDVLEQCGDQMAAIGTKMNDNVSSTSTAASAVAIAKSTAATVVEEGEEGEAGITTNVSTFLDESQEISKKELLSTLLNVLGRAESKPHDACLSAQCLKSLFQASRRAKRRARDLNAKQIVNTALEVGRRTHVKLETETKKIMQELEKTDDTDGGQNYNDNEEEDDDGNDRGIDANYSGRER